MLKDDETLLQLGAQSYSDVNPQLGILEKMALAGKSNDPDMMTLDKAMRQEDRTEFIKTMYKELEDHVQRKHWMVVSLCVIPKHKTTIPIIWLMKCK